VLQKLGEHIAEALEHAAAADQRAASVTDPELRLDNERMARTWRLIARTFQFVESLEQFLLDAQKNKDLWRPKAPDDIAAEYRLYMYDEAGELLGPAMVIRAADDESAIAQAEVRAKAVNAVLRDGMRLIKRFSQNS
jgi:hypothetical protein